MQYIAQLKATVEEQQESLSQANSKNQIQA
jgi:hypothetical protein